MVHIVLLRVVLPSGRISTQNKTGAHIFNRAVQHYIQVNTHGSLESSILCAVFHLVVFVAGEK